MKVLTFVLILIILTNGTTSEAQSLKGNSPVVAPTLCPSAELFSDVTYEDLLQKLDQTLKEKNKSLVFLEFRGLQAQIDVLSNHLLSSEALNAKEATALLKKTIAHLDQLDQLTTKAKEAAKIIKEDQVVPLATLTSLKSEADACNLVTSPYTEIFKTLSDLNKELNEVLMMSQQKIAAQKEKVYILIKKLNSSDSVSTTTHQALSEHFNFIQKNILNVTKVFEFDPSVLHVARH